MLAFPGTTGSGIDELGKHMRFEGTLKTWDDDQGTGTIEPQGGGQSLFVRISAFPGDAQMPHPGEALSFEIELSPSGRKQAVRIRRLADSSRAGGSAGAKARKARPATLAVGQRRGWMLGTAVAVLLTTVGGLALMRHYEPEATARFAALNAELAPDTLPPQSPSDKAGSKAAAGKQPASHKR